MTPEEVQQRVDSLYGLTEHGLLVTIALAVEKQLFLMERQNKRFENLAGLVQALMKNKVLEKEMGHAMLKAILPDDT